MADHLRVVEPPGAARDAFEERSIRARTAEIVRPALLPALVAGSVFTLAVRNGTYDSTSRGAFAIAVWWALVLALALGLASVGSLSAPALAAAAGLTGLAALAGFSMLWAPNPEGAFGVLGLDALYLGVFVLVALFFRRQSLARWCSGIGIGVAAIIVLALVSRLFPNLVSLAEYRLLPAAVKRLSYPLGYWNGLAIFGALALPLLLGIAVESRRFAVRAAAIAYGPVLAGVIYLTSSRGGAIAAAAGVVVFLLLTTRRVVAVAGLVTAAAGGAVTVALLHARPQILAGSTGAAATSQGRSGFALILVASLVTGLVFAGLAPRLPRTTSPRVARFTLAGVVLVGAAVLIAVHPVRRVQEFTQPIVVSTTAPSDVTQHLLSGSGNGRWQEWAAALNEFEAHPWLGGGAGSFQGWWEKHRTAPLYVENPHSLYLETLGELGPLGLAFVALFLLAGIATGIRRVLRSGQEHRVMTAALVGALTVFCVGAASDWIWEIPAVGAVGVALLALVTSTAAAPHARRQGRRVPAVSLRIALVVVGIAAVAVEGLPLLTSLQISQSQAAASRGDTVKALSAANAARRLEPWAASPYLQLGLVQEQAKNYSAAAGLLADAISQDRADWSLWILLARVQREGGNPTAAKQDLAAAQQLNPLGYGVYVGNP